MKKECRHRGESKEGTEFPPSARTRDGLSSWCADCHNEASRRSRDKANERSRRAYEADRETLRVERLKALRRFVRENKARQERLRNA